MLTYIEPCGWCSSSISSTICPSNVDKSTEPCPDLSSSRASTSLISNSDNISINTDSISYGEKRNSSTYIVRSSLSHPNDYYTTKRIDELHERMDDIQISSFLKFINYHLSLKKDNDNIHINDLIKDLSNGHILIDLIEILSSTKLKREHGYTRFHSLTNVQYVLDYLKLRMQHINISPHEIVSGNRKQILALLWIIMKIFDFPAFRLTNKNCFVENTLLGFGQDRSIIIKWLNNILNQCLNTQKIHIKDFYIQTWNNGYYLSLIIKYLIPLSIKYLTIKSFDYLKELNSSDKQHFQICFNLSNYCFNTQTIINYTDKTEKSLFKYFTELHENILNILKTNHIEKLIQNNPYIKQILDTVSQTKEHSSHVINNNEQYLVCIEEEKDMTLNSMGHLISSSNLRTVEKSRVFNDEQQKMILKRKNRWEKTENIQSNYHLINNHNEISKEEPIQTITDKPSQQQQLNGTVEEIEQMINDQVKSDQPIITNKNVEQFASTVTDEEIEQMTVTNIENQLNDKLEHSIIEVQEPQQIVRLNEENNDDEQPVENKNSTGIDEKLEQLASEEPQQQVIRSNEEEKQSINEYEKSEQTAALVENNEQSTIAIEEQKKLLLSNEKFEQSHIELEPLEQKTSIINQNEPFININEKLEQSIVEIEETQQPIENKSSITTNEILEHSTSEESLPSVILNQEAAITPVENDHNVAINEKLEQPITEESSQSVLSNEENKQNAIKVIDNETSVMSNGKLEQPIIELKETKLFTAEHKKSDESSGLVQKVEQFIENKPLEAPPCIESDKKTEQTPVIIVKNNPITTNGKSEQSTIQESSSIIVSNEKTTLVPVEHKPSITTSRKLEKPVVIESQQPIALNGQTNKSTTLNKNSIPILENRYFKTSNEQQTQSTIVVKEPEQPLQTAATATFKYTKYSDIVSKPSPITNNESLQPTTSFKKHEQSTVSKKKTMSIEKPKQSLITAEDTKQVPFTSTIKESEQTEVPLEKQDQSVIVIEESGASEILNEETKTPPTKTKKSRRSHAKKGKAKNSSVKTENQQQSVVDNKEEEEEVEPSLPPLNLTTIIQEEPPSNIQNSSTTSKISPTTNNENSQNSSALRSRKNKKKKTIATTTTTTLVGKSPSPIIPTSTPHRNLFIVTKECIRDRKIIAFKCVFILICLCFSIIILVLSHK